MAYSHDNPDSGFPSRIVCLSYDTVEMLCGIGCAEKIVGIPAGIAEPGVKNARCIGSFGNPDIEAITASRPDIVIGYSEICASAAARFTRQNIPALVLHHTCLEEIYNSITLLGRLTGNTAEAGTLTDTMRRKFRELAAYTPKNRRRPVVYFEEWNRPYVCGTQWVSEVIDIAGGKDGFARRSKAKKYLEREVTALDAAAAAPEIILASWCGNPLDIKSFKQRPGWETVPAVKTGRIYEVPGEIILHPGPSLVEGARFIADIINGQAS